ncbi:MAG: glycosyltransferase [Planctomycetota bacterium]|nr:glycosyltransferase [Planctomycetota bacterium]
MGDLVSVIIPTFNRAARMPVAVRSVLAQTWRPLEIVVVDDGSPDDTPQVLRGLEPEVTAAGAIPRFIRQQNGGAAGARNTGMKAATGQWIAFLDDDDRWYPHKLAAQMARLAETGADACSAVALLVEPGASTWYRRRACG